MVDAILFLADERCTVCQSSSLRSKALRGLRKEKSKENREIKLDLGILSKDVMERAIRFIV